MGKRGSRVIFDVPLIATENEVVFTIKPDPRGANWKYWNEVTNTFSFQKDKFTGMKKKDHHLVQFRVVDDQTTTGIRFPTDPKNGMWVINEARCPGVTDTCQYDVMKPLAVIDDDTLLAVNFNETKGQKFGFTLNFVRTNCADDTNPANFLPWDPGGDNQNGGAN